MNFVKLKLDFNKFFKLELNGSKVNSQVIREYFGIPFITGLSIFQSCT